MDNFFNFTFIFFKILRLRPLPQKSMDSLQFLAESGTKMIGCVLNGVQAGQGGYGYGYGYGYGGYGYGYGKYNSHRKSKAAEEEI